MNLFHVLGGTYSHYLLEVHIQVLSLKRMIDDTLGL